LEEGFQEMAGGHDLANGAESFHFALWRPDGGGVGPALTIADRAYAPKPGAPARPAIVREACQQLAGERRTLEKRYLHKIANTTDPDDYASLKEPTSRSLLERRLDSFPQLCTAVGLLNVSGHVFFPKSTQGISLAVAARQDH